MTNRLMQPLNKLNKALDDFDKEAETMKTLTAQLAAINQKGK